MAVIYVWGLNILIRTALSDEFAHASGRHYDNDQGRFATPHSDALDANENKKLVEAIERILG
ncbi:hypothetical protein [Pseudovibrio japonicus]|nr:hypothetical protein [Pseudovibrio japonicus]